MQRLEEYIHAGGKLLRCGYTTGTCAAAATRAAADLLLAGTCPPAVAIHTPAGIEVLVDVEEAERGSDWALCSVRKDAGDDPDVTDGVLVYARVWRREGDDAGDAGDGEVDEKTDGTVSIRGGLGVGRVTKAGLDQPVGEAAINSVPRQMIAEAARASAVEHGFGGGLVVEISIPAGVELAARTFNLRLGIEGGISVLGTTGIVRPMSEDALIASIAAELSVLRATGAHHVLVVPGNYGKTFAHERLGLAVEDAVVCSNYVGATIDEAARLGFSSMLLVGHMGKMIKVAGGVMNTHSRVADARAEVFAAHAALVGASSDAIRAIMNAATTDAMVGVVREAGLLDAVMASIMRRMAEVLAQRAGGSLHVDAVVFSNTHGLLGTTALQPPGDTPLHAGDTPLPVREYPLVIRHCGEERP